MSWTMTGGKWFWVYAALIVGLWGVAVAVGVPWYVGLLWAAFQVEVVFRLIEWTRNRRAQSSANP
ncbi:hypothetical protein DVA67_021675 [Solirubrobacter sp. CPCC 204708]|uniref:Uncharacterized protein n=1 Tax=Solirubrobacter deserti TaxID=2282478 RepID=A0ABT4RFB6_9ACTN|nr:hypothetical protein [Solirubrobacter deserti]MBE2318603.1 hypothetical protein [Solirubrobacter deserti]MDA0137061.1 hypothetical protein [Solirubrobacter deserti]